MEWKICRVDDVHTARFCAAAGADYIGLHAIDALSEDKTRVFKAIGQCSRTKKLACVPVLLTKIRDRIKIAEMVKATGVSTLQLHYRATTNFFEAIHAAIGEIDGSTAQFFGVVSAADKSACDLILMYAQSSLVKRIILDANWTGGTGVTTRATRLNEILHSIPQRIISEKILIAGGISATNFQDLANNFLPAGFDVQSSLETKIDKRKSGHFIKQFSIAINKWSPDKFASVCFPSVSVSLTNVSKDESGNLILEAASLGIECLHIDYSDGHLVQSFNVTQGLAAVANLADIHPTFPYDLHLFIETPAAFRDALQRFCNVNSLLRIAYLYCGNTTTKDIILVSECSSICSENKVAFGISLHAPRYDHRTTHAFIQEIAQYDPRTLLLITHSRSHTLELINSYDVPLAKDLIKIKQSLDMENLEFVLDRDINLEKLALFAGIKIDGVVVGKEFKNSPDREKLVHDLRRTLMLSKT